jgi:aminotransferase in exopolysaccharide biosynthesis
MDKFQIIVDKIREIYNKKENFIPLHEPRFVGNEKKYLNDCIDSTFVSSVGKYVNQFEEMVAKYTESKHAIACVNGTAALHIALVLSNVSSNDEVITQPLTFIATANAISYTGAKPVFVDVDKDTMGLSPKSLKDFIDKNCTQKDGFTINKNTGNRIKACIPMHTFGHPCKIDEIKEICNQHNITLIEDAAESLGSYYKGKHTGTFGDLGTLSFNGNKTITCGGGGMILTDNDKFAKLAKHITTTAKIPHKWEFVHDMVAYNYRLTNLSAALGCAQMEMLPQFIENKRNLAKQYSTFFKNIDNIQFVEEQENTKANYWLNAIILENKEHRDSFLETTNNQGVMTRPIWQLMNKLEMFKGCQCSNLSNAEWLEERVVNIPSSVIFN